MFGSIIQNAADAIVLVLLFSLTIFVHELGHFLLALKCGMRIDTFSIGFGPAIWKRTIKGITYKIAWIPLGGYVALPQLDPAGMSSVQSGDKETADPDPAAEQPAPPVPSIPAWKKILVSFAGAGGNLLFALLLAWVIYLSPDAPPRLSDTGARIGFVQTNSAAYRQGVRMGDEILAVNGEDVNSWNDVMVLSAFGAENTNGVRLTLRSDEDTTRTVSLPTLESDMDLPMLDGIARAMLCVVNNVAPDSPAAQAGLQAGDIVRRCAGEPVVSTQHFIELVSDRGGQPTPLLVERGDEERTVEVTPHYNAELDRALIGVEITSGIQGVAQWMQYKRPLAQIKGDASGIFRLLRALVTPHEAKQAAKGLGGPIMIITALWMSIKISLLNAIGFIRFLNVNLAILNLLPIPVLDGGHILFALWEGITRRRISARVVNVLINVFMALLLGLIILLSFRDVVRIPDILKALNRSPAAETQEDTSEAAPTNHPAP